MRNHGPMPRITQNAIRPVTKYGPKPKPLAERFWAKVQKLEGPDACWLWTGTRNGKCGYGMIYDADVGDKMLAHRVAWKLAFGAYPVGVVRHLRCDNEACVRIDHLAEGTQADNMRDKAERCHATNQYKSLTFDQAEEVRQLYASGKYSQMELERVFGVDQTTVSRIVRKTTLRSRPIESPPKTKLKRSPKPRLTVEERFWAKVDNAGPPPAHLPDLGPCWLWTASVSNGRGSFRSVHQRAELAHRISWELTYGPIPKGLVVCHRCDVGLCVRPEHLFLGMQQDNIADMRAKVAT